MINRLETWAAPLVYDPSIRRFAALEWIDRRRKWKKVIREFGRVMLKKGEKQLEKLVQNRYGQHEYLAIRLQCMAFWWMGLKDGTGDYSGGP